MTTMRLVLRCCAALAVAALPFAGCSESLKESPESFIGPSNFYKTEADAQAALIGAYSALRQNDEYPAQRNYHIMVSFPTPVMSYAQPGVVAARDQSDNWQFTSGHEYVNNTYNRIYIGILRANAVIQNVPTISMNQGRKDAIIAEARFLRAFHYFNALRLWGPVPLVTTETQGLVDLDKPRATPEEMYAFLTKELTEIQSVLPAKQPANGYGRATSVAAQTLLGLTYLHRASGATPGATPVATDAANAATELRKVVNNVAYGLTPNYADLFNEANDGKLSEPIFCVVHTPDAGSQLAHFMAPDGSRWLGGQFPSYQAEWPFLMKYAAGDKRYAATWLLEYFHGPKNKTVTFTMNAAIAATDDYHLIGPMPNKHLVKRIGTTLGSGDKDFCMHRVGGVMLALAEAINRQSGPTAEAFDMINRVRARAGLTPLAGLGKDAFMKAVYDELLFELATEEEDFFSGLRHWAYFKAEIESNSRVSGLPTPAIPTVKISLDDHHRVFPLPLGAMDANPKLVQNTGY